MARVPDEMIQILKRFVEWLEHRFPPRIVLTQANYDELIDMVKNNHKDIVEVIWPKLNDLEKEIHALKEGIVKGEIRATQTPADKLRDDFVRGDFARIRGVGRQELENAAK